MAEPSVLDPSGMSMTGPATSPLRAFLRTEAASASVLAAAIALALVWANVSGAGYDAFWTRELPIRIGPLSANLDLRTWVNSGLMAFFFLVVGLEARREFDLASCGVHCLPVASTRWWRVSRLVWRHRRTCLDGMRWRRRPCWFACSGSSRRRSSHGLRHAV